MIWQEKEGALIARFSFNTYSEAFAFVKSLALHSEAVNHHPLVLWDYTLIELRLTTKDKANTISSLDRDFADWVLRFLAN